MKTTPMQSNEMMKKYIIMLAVLVLALTWSLAHGTTPPCPSGWTEWEGSCAAIPNPELSTTPKVQPSKEKPPRDKMPSWEREGIHVDEAKPMAAADANHDAEVIEANIRGKLKAGVPLTDEEKEWFRVRGIPSK